MPCSDPLRPAERARVPGAVTRACTTVLRVLYVGTALVGLLFTPPIVSLVLVPLLAGASVVLLASFVWYVEEHWPTRETLTTAAVASAALLPFGVAVQVLETVGEVMAFAVLALLTVACVEEVSQSAGRLDGPPPEGGADLDVERLGELPVHQLLAHWRSVGRLTPGTGAAALRAALLDELQRRDPAAFSAWLSTGAAGPPDEHFRHDSGSPT